jgi:hypothetical protein
MMPKLPEPDMVYTFEAYSADQVRAIQEEAYRAGMADAVPHGHYGSDVRIRALEAALRQAREALKYHTEQTRPIVNSQVAMHAINDLLKD